jgi:hypothetical protein
VTVIPIRGAKEAPKDERSTMETLVLTPEMMKAWVLPAFQAPLKTNAKVREVADELSAQTGTPCINGVISLGRLRAELKSGAAKFYLIDGQHRREAVLISGIKEVFADVRSNIYESMEEMAREYLRLNSPISRKTPDDQLRALQESSPALKLISHQCPYVGYRYIRANSDSPIVGMSAVLRRWWASGRESPAISGGGGAASEVAHRLTVEEAGEVVHFLQVVYAAWGRDIENARLWGSLNMVICMWLWRVLVLDKDRTGSRRYITLTEEQFKQCMMAASADKSYVDWLLGRNMAERDRAPCYRRLRTIFMARLPHVGVGDLHGRKIKMPQPTWMNN